jgi:hypothetical protein
MAKQHRMFVLTLGALLGALDAFMAWPPRALPAALILIILGSAVTTWRRASRLLRDAAAR